MNFSNIYTTLLFIFLIVNSSFAMEGESNDLSWFEIARLERNADAMPKVEDSKAEKSDIDFAEIFKETPTRSFKDIIGEIPEEITRMVHKINQKHYYEKCGLADSSHEVLLIGPPGTGKSSLAEAIATETRRDFYKVGSSALINSYQGSGAATIRSIFEQVRRNGKPAVIFIDEIDGISNNENKSNTGESDRAVKELQMQIDKRDSLIICILATNNYENLSGALKDRFAHKTITISLPNLSKRLAILKYYAQKQKVTVSNEFLSKLARLTDQLSCRSLEKLSQEAFNMAFEQQFLAIKSKLDLIASQRDTGKEKESEGTVKIETEPHFEVKDIHYLVAAYTTQNTTLPSLTMRIILFKYFFKKKNLNAGSENLIILAKKTEGFSAQNIKDVVGKTRDIFDEKKQFSMLDIYAALYYEQTISLADSFMRAQLFEYYLGEKNIQLEHCSNAVLCSMLAYHTEDSFTSKEISEIVTIASEIAEVENTAITEINLIIALCKSLEKKVKPYLISVSKIIRPILVLDTMTYSTMRSYEMRELSADEKFLKISSIRTSTDHHPLEDEPDTETITRLDYRSKVDPDLAMRYLLIQHFLEDIPHAVSLNQIHSLAIYTEKLSCYALKELVTLSKNRALSILGRKLQFKHLVDAAYEFDKLSVKEISDDSTQKSSCILS